MEKLFFFPIKLSSSHPTNFTSPPKFYCRGASKELHGAQLPAGLNLNTLRSLEALAHFWLTSSSCLA